MHIIFQASNVSMCDMSQASDVQGRIHGRFGPITCCYSKKQTTIMPVESSRELSSLWINIKTEQKTTPCQPTSQLFDGKPAQVTQDHLSFRPSMKQNLFRTNLISLHRSFLVPSRPPIRRKLPSQAGAAVLIRVLLALIGAGVFER